MYLAMLAHHELEDLSSPSAGGVPGPGHCGPANER